MSNALLHLFQINHHSGDCHAHATVVQVVNRGSLIGSISEIGDSQKAIKCRNKVICTKA